MPWHRFVVSPSTDPFEETTHYVWDPGADVEAAVAGDALTTRAALEIGLSPHSHSYTHGGAVDHPPPEAREATRARYAEMERRARGALWNLEPAPRCEGCGCLKARALGGLESHDGGCPYCPF